MATFLIKGECVQAGLPVARNVYAYLQSDGTLVGSALSDATDGSFTIVLAASEPVVVVAFPASSFAPISVGPLTPLPG